MLGAFLLSAPLPSPCCFRGKWKAVQNGLGRLLSKFNRNVPQGSFHHMDKAAKAKSLWIYQVWEAIQHETQSSNPKWIGRCKNQYKVTGSYWSIETSSGRISLAWTTETMARLQIGARYWCASRLCRTPKLGWTSKVGWGDSCSTCMPSALQDSDWQWIDMANGAIACLLSLVVFCASAVKQFAIRQNST